MATKKEKILAQLSELISSANVDIYANGKSSVIGTLASIYNIFNTEKAKEEKKKRQAQNNEPDIKKNPEMNPENDDQDQNTGNSGYASDDESGNDRNNGKNRNDGDEGEEGEGNSEERNPSSNGSKGKRGKSKLSSSGEDDEGEDDEGDDDDVEGSDGSDSKGGKTGRKSSSDSGEFDDTDDEFEPGNDDSDESGKKEKSGKRGAGSGGDYDDSDEFDDTDDGVDLSDDDSIEFNDTDDEFKPGDNDSDDSDESDKKRKPRGGGIGNGGDYDGFETGDNDSDESGKKRKASGDGIGSGGDYDDSDEFDDTDDEVEPDDDSSEEGQQGNHSSRQGNLPGQQSGQNGQDDDEDGEDYDDEYEPGDAVQGNQPGQQSGQNSQPGQNSQSGQPGLSGQPGQNSQSGQPGLSGQNGQHMQQLGQQPGQNSQSGQPGLSGQNGQQLEQPEQPVRNGQQPGDESNPDDDSADKNGTNPRALKVAMADGNSSGNGRAIMDHESSHVISSQEMDEKQKSSSGTLKKNEADTASPFADLNAIFGSALAGTFKRIENDGGLSAEELKAMHDLEETIKGRQRKNKRSIVNWPAKLRKFFKGSMQIGKTRFTTSSKFHPDAALKRRREPVKPSGRKIAIFIDTSGSVFGTPGALQQFLTEITKIATGDSAFKYYDIIPFSDDINFEATLIEQPKSVIASKEWSISNIAIGYSTIYDSVYNFIYDYYINHKADDDAENLSDEEKVKIKYKPNCILIVSDTDVCWNTNKFSTWASLPKNKEKGEAITKAFNGKCCFLGLHSLRQDSEEHPIQDMFAEACIPGTKVVPILYDDFAQYVDLSGQDENEDLDENYSINNNMNTEYFTILNEGFKKGGIASNVAKPNVVAPNADSKDLQNPGGDANTPGADNTRKTRDLSDHEVFMAASTVSKEAATMVSDNAFTKEIRDWVEEALKPWGLRFVDSEAQCRNAPQTYTVDSAGRVVINNQLSSNSNSRDDQHVSHKQISRAVTFPSKAFDDKYINADITIKKYIGNLIISGFKGTKLPKFIPKQIRGGENGGNFIITDCSNLNSIENFPTYVDTFVKIYNTDLTQTDVDNYKSIVMNSWKDFRNKNGLPLNNPPRFDANDIFENNNYIMNRNINRIVESRRRLAEAYRMQSSPIMKVNETFGYLDKENPDYNSIPLELNRIATLSYNKPIIRKLTSEIRAPWGYLTTDMVDVYDKPADYHKMVAAIPGKKEIGSELQYGIMIFTDAQDRITYILRGSEADSDSFYIDPDLIKLIPERVNLMREIKDVIKNFDIDPNSFAAGKNGNTLDEFCSKLVYDAICKYQDDDTMASAYGFFNIYTFEEDSTYREICDNIKQVISDCAGGKKLINPTTNKVTEIPKNLTFKLGDTTASLMFKRIISEHGDTLRKKFDFNLGKVINPILLRAILQAANIRDIKDAALFNSTSNSTYTIYSAEELEKMSNDELIDVYNKFSTMNVTNSMLYNFSVKVNGEKGSIKPIEELTQPSALLLFPDMVSHLYWIKNVSTTNRKYNSDPTIPELDFENIDKLDDPAARAEEFNSDETIRKARERFMTKGPEPYRKPGYKYTSKKSERWPKMWDNLEKYGDKAEEVRSDATAGLYVSKKERENFRARDARDAWNADHDRAGARFDILRAKTRLNNRTRRMIDVENDPKNPDVFISAVKGDENFIDIFRQFRRNFLLYTKVMKNGKMRFLALYDKIIDTVKANGSKEFKPNLFLKYYSNIYDFVTFVNKQNYEYHDPTNKDNIIAILNFANTLLGDVDNNGVHVSWFNDDNAKIMNAVENQDDAQMRAAMDTIAEHNEVISKFCDEYKLKVYRYNRSSIFGNN